MEFLVPGLMAIAIGLVHFFGEEIDELTRRYNRFLVSFSTGFTLAYFFAVLIPETSRYSILKIQNLTVLIGLTVFYILEELVYERDENFGEVKYNFKELHTGFIGMYHMAIGTILNFLFQNSVQQSLLFFIPVLIHTSVNSLALKEMHEEMLENRLIKVLISLSTFIGVLIGSILNMPISFLYSLLGVLGGSFIYIVIHDAMNPRRERPTGFITGVISFFSVLYILL